MGALGFDTEYMIQVSCYVPVFVWLYVILYYLIAIELLSSAKTVWFNVGSGEAAPQFGFCFIINLECFHFYYRNNYTSHLIFYI